ncbi:MAG: FHA domain-containing protein [Desulfobulbaceae bacterium]|uniref:FHA domain-containing protein n=1 Tax=Candidatus Desulfobia pelagia TaxID=2841692 RepID=A0A8J6NFS2_9BACT|nr:FHA domain-containing protein [Candidatus Desulfobia pelagia]
MPVWTVRLNDKIVKQFSIDNGDRKIIGRGGEASVVVDNTAISREHTALILKNDTYYIEDLGSLNGTMVNGRKIDALVQLFEGDTIEIGKFHLLPTGTEKKAPLEAQSTALDYGDETVFVRPKKPLARPASKAEEKPVHRLLVVQGTASPREISLDRRNSIKIGKDPSSDLLVTGFLVARAQCYIIKREQHFYIVPQRSWVGTRLNSFKVKREHLLRKGDLIEIKKVQILFE